MKRLSPKLHGILDYVTVTVLALSPWLFDMRPYAAIFTYALAFIHLILTLSTNFEMGVFRIVPLYVHGIIEISVSILLVVASLLFRIYHDNTSFYFYLIFAVVLFVVWGLSDYKLVSPLKKLI